MQAHFLSNPRPISGIARKDSVTSLSIKLEARSAVHRCFWAYQIDMDTDLFGVWLVEMSYGRIRRSGTEQDPFIYDDRRRSGPSACLLTEARDRATSDWGRLSRARSYPMRAMVPARSRGSSRRLVSGAWCRFFVRRLPLSEVIHYESFTLLPARASSAR